MKLREIMEDCLEIKEYLQELTGDDEKIDMGIKFQNLKIVYLMPEIYENNIDKIAKKCFKKENDRFILIGEGQNCIESIKDQIQKFEKKIIENNTKNLKKED